MILDKSFSMKGSTMINGMTKVMAKDTSTIVIKLEVAFLILDIVILTSFLSCQRAIRLWIFVEVLYQKDRKKLGSENRM